MNDFKTNVNLVIDALHGDSEIPPDVTDLVVIAALYKVVKLLLKESSINREVDRG